MTFPMPQPPTDNLYKFVALSGVVLIVAGQSLPFSIFREVVDRRLEAESLNLLRKAHQENDAEFLSGIQQDSEQLRREVDELMAEKAKGLPPDPTLKPELEAKIQAIFEKTERSRERLAESRIRNAQWEAKALQHSSLIAEYDLRSNMGFALHFLGVVMALWGFRRWYVVFQKPLDAKARAELAETGGGQKRTAPTNQVEPEPTPAAPQKAGDPPVAA